MTPRGRLLAALLGAALAAPAGAQSSSSLPASGPSAPAPATRPSGATGQARLPPTVNAPVNLQGQTPARPFETAPMPNRDIEAPRDRFGNALNPRFEPLMLPPDRRQGATFGAEHLRETGPDRPLDTLVPGARLRIPFE